MRDLYTLQSLTAEIAAAHIGVEKVRRIGRLKGAAGHRISGGNGEGHSAGASKRRRAQQLHFK